jgi:hypothetical protein
MKKPNVFLYTTLCNPDMARELLLKNGYDNVPKNYAEVSRLLADYVSKNEEKGLNDILQIHPDLEAIKNYLKVKSATGMKDPTGEFMYCAGCPATKMSADAQAPAATQQPVAHAAISEKVTNALIIGGSIVLASIMVTVIITSAIHASK